MSSLFSPSHTLRLTSTLALSVAGCHWPLRRVAGVARDSHAPLRLFAPLSRTLPSLQLTYVHVRRLEQDFHDFTTTTYDP